MNGRDDHDANAPEDRRAEEALSDGTVDQQDADAGDDGRVLDDNDEPTPDEGVGATQGRRRGGVASRGIVVFVGVFLVAVLLLVWAFFRSSDSFKVGAEVASISPPTGITANDPENAPNPHYQELILEKNADRIEMAVTSGADAVVPPLVGAGEVVPQSVVNPAMTVQTAPEPKRQPRTAPLNPEALLAAIEALNAQWALDGSTVLVGKPRIEQVTLNRAGLQGQSDRDAGPRVPLMQVQHAVLVVGVNTDYPSDVVAKITDGPLRGARFLGSVQAANSAVQDRAMLRFRRMVWKEHTYAVDALAVDPGTRIPAIEGDINHHIVHNTLYSVASSYLLGYAAGISQGGVGGLGVVLPLNSPDLTPVPGPVHTGPGTSALLRGQAASVIGGQLGEMQYRGPTVTIPAGYPIGIVITSQPTTSGGSATTRTARGGAIRATLGPAPTGMPNVTTVLEDGSVVSVHAGGS